MSKKATLSEIIAQHMVGSVISINFPSTASCSDSNKPAQTEPVAPVAPVARATEQAGRLVVGNASAAPTAKGDAMVETAVGAAKRPSGENFVPLDVMPRTVPLSSFSGEPYGELVVSQPTPEQCRILQEVFDLSPDLLEDAGLRRAHYTPVEDENLGFYCDDSIITLPDALPLEITSRTPGSQWCGHSPFKYLPPIPSGESLRFPIHNKAGALVGYSYHRIISRVDGNGEVTHDILTYHGPKAKRQPGFVPCNAPLLADPQVPLVCGQRVPGAECASKGRCSGVVSLSGSIHYGFSAQGHFYPGDIEDVRKRAWMIEDAAALFELLRLEEIPFYETTPSLLGGREVIILCELNWLRQEYLEMALPLLQQVIALHEHLQGWGACSRVLTAPITGLENSEVEVDLDHMLGAGEWGLDDLTAYNSYPGFHSAM